MTAGLWIAMAIYLLGTVATNLVWRRSYWRLHNRLSKERDASRAAQEKMAQALKLYRSDVMGRVARAGQTRVRWDHDDVLLAALRAHEKEVRER